MILTWVAGGALVLAAGIATRWALRRRDSLGRALPFPIISVVLSLLLAVAGGIPSVQHARLEDRLSEASERVIGIPVKVHCQTFGQTWTDLGPELGYVRYGPDGPEHETLIKLQQCHDLAGWLGVAGRYAAPGQQPPAAADLQQVIAVHVLSHESMHMAGQVDEARAECQAVQRDEQFALLLGATPEGARALARRYWTEVYPRLSEGYRTPDCRAGGTLDEGRAAPPWATTQP